MGALGVGAGVLGGGDLIFFYALARIFDRLEMIRCRSVCGVRGGEAAENADVFCGSFRRLGGVSCGG